MKVSQSASGYAVHPEYQLPTPLANDVGLVQLYGSVPLSSAVNAIQLPPRSDVNIDYTGKSVIVAGFGQTADGGYPKLLQYTYLTALSNAVCKSVHWVFRDTMLCARSASSSSSMCFGDSGKSIEITLAQVAT